MNPTRVFTGCLLAALCAMVPVAVASEPARATASAREVVDSLEQALIESMKQGPSLTLAQRKEQLAPVIDRALDFSRMARFIFGANWREMSEADRTAFLEAFRELSVTTYAARFDVHKGERFDSASEAAQGGERILVRSRFTKGGGDKVAFDYLMMRSGGEWRIVNILTDGISDLALKRSQYGGLYGREGMAAVLANIGNQTRRLHEE